MGQPSECLIGLDVGTTGCKAIVFDPEGEKLGAGFREYGILTDGTNAGPGKPDRGVGANGGAGRYGAAGARAEQDAAEVWKVTLEVLKTAIQRSGVPDIKALSLSVQGDAIIPVDRDIRPLRHAVLGMDYRSAAQAEECERLIGSRTLFDMTGMRPHPMNSLVKLLWLRDAEPEIYDKTWKVMTYADFILSRLGAGPVIDFTMASRTMGFDLIGKKWSQEILQKLGVDSGLFSDAQPSGTAVGQMSGAVADHLGIARGTLLVTGGHDQTCAGIGAGLVREGQAVVSTGTAEVLSTAFPKPKLGDAMYEGYYPCYLYARDGMYFTFSLNHVGGILLQWYRQNFGAVELQKARAHGADFYQLMDGNAPREPTDLFVLPHFNGSGTPWCDLSSKGAVVGLSLATNRYHIYRSMLESLAYELKINMETMQRAGIRFDEIRAAGGGASSRLWLQIKADVLGSPILTLRESQAACLGSAILAGAAAGVYSDVDEGVGRIVHTKDTYLPDGVRSQSYALSYGIYKDLYPALKSINRRLS